MISLKLFLFLSLSFLISCAHVENMSNFRNIASTAKCNDLVLELIKNEKKTSAFKEPIEKYVTTDLIDIVPGLHGGTLNVLQKHEGKKWISSFRVNADLTPNPESAIAQGNPSFFIDLVGEKKSKFWGFHKIDSDKLTLPDALELNGAIKKLNSYIENKEDKININFYSIAAEIDIETFVQRFSQSKSIPIAEKGIVSVHDRSVHFASIFMPRYIDEMAQIETQTFIKFAEFVKKNDNALFLRNKEIFDEKFILLAENLDNRSANITNFLQAFTNQKFNLETIDNLSNFMFIVYGNTSYSAQLKFKYFIETKFRNEYVEPTPDSIKIAKLSELFDQKNLSSNNEKYLRVYPKINVNSLAQQILERVEFLMSKTPVL